MSLILSNEIFDAGYHINFRNKTLFKYEYWLTNGEMLIDIRKNYITETEYIIKECPDGICKNIDKLTSENSLKKELSDFLKSFMSGLEQEKEITKAKIEVVSDIQNRFGI